MSAKVAGVNDQVLGAAGEVVLSARGISKSYGQIRALDDVNISLARGEIAALVGDNGAGKSSLVNILAGALQPDSGEIRLNGVLVQLATPRFAQELGISTVFQDLALVDQRDVAANLFLGRERRKFRFLIDRRRMVAEAADVVERLGVGLPSVRSRVIDLSGGQRQAVAVARAWAQGGVVTLLDEPTAALGVREAGRVTALVRRLRDEGHAVLLVSHNLHTVFELADRVVVLRHGRCVAQRRIVDTTQEAIVSLVVGVSPRGTHVS